MTMTYEETVRELTRATKSQRMKRPKKTKMILVPEEGEDWKGAQESEETTRALDVARVAAFHRIATEELASYCHLNSISDAECQRIADRINYEHSPKNHLRNPKPLKSISDIIAQAPKINFNNAVYTRLKQERAQATDAEFAKLQAKASEEAEWVDVPQGSVLLDDDEKKVTIHGHKPGKWVPIGGYSVGFTLENTWWQVRRRKPSPPVEEWRMLEIGEICQGSDEQTIFGNDDEFIPVLSLNIGSIYTNPGIKLRRRHHTMKTAINLEPPSIISETSLEELLAPGCDVYVDLSGKLYPGKVGRISGAPGEVSIETTAARHMSRSWKVLLFYIESRRAVYGSGKLVIPGIDSFDASTIQPEYEKKKPGEPPAAFDAPEALSRDFDDPTWEEKSTLEPEEAQELWFNRDRD